MSCCKAKLKCLVFYLPLHFDNFPLIFIASKYDFWIPRPKITKGTHF